MASPLNQYQRVKVTLKHKETDMNTYYNQSSTKTWEQVWELAEESSVVIAYDTDEKTILFAGEKACEEFDSANEAWQAIRDNQNA